MILKVIHLPVVVLSGVIPLFSATVEPFFEHLPPGLFIESSFVVPNPQTVEISAKLGGGIDRITNSKVNVQGRTIQVNCITAADETNAKRIHDSIGKPFPFTTRTGLRIVEFVTRGTDLALALKTSFELGLLPKPERLHFTYLAELATVDQAHYLSCNPLFNEFLRLQGGDAAAGERIAKIAEKFRFGNSVTLRTPNSDASYTLIPHPTRMDPASACTVYSFEELPVRNTIPYVTLMYTGITSSNPVCPTDTPPSAECTAATSFWPVENPAVKHLANRITESSSGTEGKVQAILKWLKPGLNLKYSGQTGSRWGTLKVLEQGFGHCWDFSDVFVTLCRASGVPCRQVAGWLFGASGHVWAEYYVENEGWKQVDPTGGGSLRCGIYHIPLFTTDNGEMPIVYLSMPQINAKFEARS